ncbi:MAG: helix-turn-helix domain-containing protein [Eubacteriales bacterium]|nr:helix-turn-helix domain-containing protein [Eubacteriales bacterium]
MNISEAVVKRVFELCGQRKLTVNALCNLSGVTQSTVNDIVGGTTYSAGVAAIKKLCGGLDISVRGFFDTPLFVGLDQKIK